jgi:cyanophycinase
MGYLLLEGGAEFGGRMAEPDWRAIEQAGGFDARLRLLPTAAAPDHNHQRAGNNGKRWFQNLGARDVAVVPVLDRASAEARPNAAALESANLIYLLGGFTHYLGQTLKDSPSAAAMRAAYEAGAVVAGSSAGAMVLCQHYYDPESQRIFEGLGYAPRACVIPHHDTFGARWAARLGALLPQSVLIGIDEQTGMLDDGSGRVWRVYGRGAVTLYRAGQAARFETGTSFQLYL